VTFPLEGVRTGWRHYLLTPEFMDEELALKEDLSKTRDYTWS
jgi:hypothetical protein